MAVSNDFRHMNEISTAYVCSDYSLHWYEAGGMCVAKKAFQDGTVEEESYIVDTSICPPEYSGRLANKIKWLVEESGHIPTPLNGKITWNPPVSSSSSSSFLSRSTQSTNGPVSTNNFNATVNNSGLISIGENAEIVNVNYHYYRHSGQEQTQPVIQCHTSHPDFVGRKTELEKLSKALLHERKSSDETRFCFLYGLGGVGKSELTIRFANNHQETFAVIWFFPASNDQLLYEAYQELAQKLSIPFSANDGLDILQGLVHRHLEETSAYHPYLLIFDNVEKEMNAQKFPQRGGTILMTSRESKHWRNNQSSVCVEKFEEEDALELLKQITQEESSDEMERLSSEILDQFPFLINQVAHYISAQSMTISEYLQFFDFKKKDDISPDERYKKTFDTVWEVTFTRVKDKHLLAFEWLKVCAVLHPDSIPVKWLEEWVKARGIQDSSKERIKILGTLSKYALIQERDPKSDSVSLHRLLQVSLKSQVEDLSGFLLDVYKFIKKHSKDFDDRNGNHAWIPHAEEILEVMRENKLSIKKIKQEIYCDLGNGYYSLGEYQKALEFHLKDLEIAKRLGDLWGEGRAYGNIGTAYQALRKYKQALEFHLKHLEIAKRLGDLGWQGGAYGNMGNTFGCLGEHQKAILFHLKDLEIALRLGDLGGKGRVYGNIGNAYDSLGEHQKALAFHKKHLEIAKRLGNQGEEGMAYGNISTAYQALGDYEQAKGCYEQALTIAKRIGYRRLKEFAERKLAELNSKDSPEPQPKEEANNRWCSII